MFGIYEVIVLALALGGFGVEPNPKPASPDVVLEYAVEDADVVAYVDAVPLIPGNYTALKKLADAPEIKNNAALRDVVGKVVAEVEGTRGTVKTVVGVDLTTDLSNVAMFARLSATPELLLVARGRFPADMPDKIAKMTGGKVETIGQGQALALGPGPLEVLALDKAGVLFLGARKLVTDRLAPGWNAPARKGILADTARLLADKPVYLVAASTTSGRLVDLMKANGAGEAAAFLARFTFVAAALHHNGLSWVMQDKDAAGHSRSVMASEGYVDILRAMHLAPRGFAKVVVSFLDDVQGTDPELAVLKQHKGDLLKLVDQFTGDGNFKVKMDKDARGFRVGVRLTGKRLSDVVPLGVVIPGMAFALLSGSSKQAVTAPPAPPATIVKPRTGGGIKATPKPRPKPAPAPVK
jgi:hypothetical protein